MTKNYPTFRNVLYFLIMFCFHTLMPFFFVHTFIEFLREETQQSWHLFEKYPSLHDEFIYSSAS